MEEEIFQKMSENDDSFEAIVTTSIIEGLNLHKYSCRPLTAALGVSWIFEKH